ncbi:hypothetical protein OROMI_023598 [Orobanche minor]
MDIGASKYQAPIFDGKMDFTVWQMTMQDVLVQQGLDEALEENKPEDMKDADWRRFRRRLPAQLGV